MYRSSLVYANNIALRSSLQKPMSGNEALHATMRRQVYDVYRRQFIDEQNWDAQSSPSTISGFVQKDNGPLAAQRKECVRVFAPRRKSKKGRRFVKRTVFDARRKSHLSGKNCKW